MSAASSTSTATHRRSSVNPLPSATTSTTPIVKKSPSLLKRLSSRSNNKENSSDSNSSKQKQKHFRLLKVVAAPLRRRSNRFGSSSTTTTNSSSSSNMTTTESAHSQLFTFLQGDCPEAVLPTILAFAGPQKTAALSKTNRFWNKVISQEGTWRVMCEDLYKWTLGEPEPASWREHYRLTPCVPVDFRSVHAAMEVTLGEDHSLQNNRRHQSAANIQRRSVCILLRPGNHYLKEAINVQAVNGASVTIETLVMPTNVFRPCRLGLLPGDQVPEQPQQKHPTAAAAYKRNKHHPLRNFIRRARTGSDYPMEETEFSDGSLRSAEDWMDFITEPPKRATLVLRSRRHNEPAFRIRQGDLFLKNVDIQHNSHGIDIWNGNAAIQIQPPLGADDLPLQVGPRPNVTLQGVLVSSRSGRGIVNIDGGLVSIIACAVHDCAATGIYIGGRGSSAVVERTDVLRNGVGNRSTRGRGIARGHSGVYLEQGNARISDSNISFNTLTGISSVSPENAILTLTSCDLTMNGTFQLEMPEQGSNARRRSVTRDNSFSPTQPGPLRSGLMPENDSAEHGSTINALLG